MLLSSMQVQSNLKQAYELAYRKVCEEFRRWDPEDMAQSSGSSYDPSSGKISLRYIDELYTVRFPSGEVCLLEKSDPVAVTVKIVLLNYLVRAGGQPLKNSWISFKEIPQGGMIYLDAFNRRIRDQLTAVFGEAPDLLLKAGASLGGKQVHCGDCGVQLQVLPRFPVTFAIWNAAEDTAPGATVLYDATAPFYLPTEVLIEATSFCIRQLTKAAKLAG